MNFNSIQYLVFLAVNVALYYLLPRRARNFQLLLASYYFYMCWNPVYALLMLFSTAVTYGCGLLVGYTVWGKRRLWVALSLVLNLGVLFFFKYYNFAADVLTRGLDYLGLSMDVPLLDVLLPVGISFYTFQALGYTIDVYRKDVPAERNFFDYALFISFFPQLVAGPIERSGNILHQLKEYHPFRYENLRAGMTPVVWGLFKKVVIADNLAVLVNTVYNAPQGQGGGAFLVATAAFAFQIYCDFSAYSDIARGSAKMLGFQLMENFNCPYFSQSIKEFWRRWHISLSSWFKDYLYFPLGGSRKGKGRTCLNILIVFFVSGLWHGAALTFVAWGLLNGLYQVVSLLFDPLRKKAMEKLGLSGKELPLQLFRVAVTFCLTCLAWVLFRANSLTDALTAYQALLSLPATGFAGTLAALGQPNRVLALLAGCVALLGVMDWAIHQKDLFPRLERTVAARYGLCFLFIAGMLVFGSYGEGYDPQAFVYFQF